MSDRRSVDCTDAELRAYLDEALPVAEMTRLEQALRSDENLARRLAVIATGHDSGAHSLGEIWRRHRLSCPSRARLGSYLLDVLSDDEAAWIRSHIELLGCRYCQANLDDLRSEQITLPPASAARRQRYFQSSAGRLRRK